MIRSRTEGNDGALDALTTLSEVTTSSVEGLNELNEDLADARQHRREGWSWQRIVAGGDLHHSLSTVAAIAADLGRASGQFRRSLARMLRSEGMLITDISRLLYVSRQRVSALLRSRTTESVDGRVGSFPPDGP